MGFLQAVLGALPTVALLCGFVVAIVDQCQYKNSVRYRRDGCQDVILTYKVFRKLYNVNPQNFELYAIKSGGITECLIYKWTNPVNGDIYRIFFTSFRGYAAMKLVHRATWFKRHVQKKRQQKIKETEASLEFVDIVRKALTKKAEDAARAYEKCVDDELRKAKLRAKRYANDKEVQEYISIFPGT